MAEPVQYKFAWQEVATALVKKQGLHEGTWMIGGELSISVGLVGPAQHMAIPGASVGISSLLLIAAAEDSPRHLVVDAAEVNPRRETSGQGAGRRRRKAG